MRPRRFSFLGQVFVPFILAALCASGAGNGQISLAWDPNTEPDVNAYILHYGVVSGSYGSSTNVGNQTTATVTGLSGGTTYYFAVTARNASGLVSDFSKEVSGGPALEADVFPRPNGDGILSAQDWVQAGRLAMGLDAITNRSEFQRVDTAPRLSGATLVTGDGVLGFADWSQAGRYYAGLDPLTAAGGPLVPMTGGADTPLNTLVETNGAAKAALGTRRVRAVSQTVSNNNEFLLLIELDSQGNENTLGFSLEFDSKVLRFNGADLGLDARRGVLLVNTNQSVAGRVGVGVALFSGETFSTGLRAIVGLRFVPMDRWAGSSTISFGDTPIRREIVDSNVNLLTGEYVSATITSARVAMMINKTSGQFTLSWPVANGGFVAEATDTLSQPVWIPVAEAPIVVDGRYVLPIKIENQSRFYRLKQGATAPGP